MCEVYRVLNERTLNIIDKYNEQNKAPSTSESIKRLKLIKKTRTYKKVKTHKRGQNL